MSDFITDNMMSQHIKVARFTVHMGDGDAVDIWQIAEVDVRVATEVFGRQLETPQLVGGGLPEWSANEAGCAQRPHIQEAENQLAELWR